MILPLIAVGLVGTVIGAKIIAKEAGASFSEGASKNFNATIDRTFDKLSIFAKNVDFIGQKWIDKAEGSVVNLIDKTSDEVSKIIDEILEKAIYFSTHFAETTFDNLIKPTLRKIEELEDKFFQELNKVIDRVETIINNAMDDIKGTIDKIVDYDLMKIQPQNWFSKKNELVDFYEQKKQDLLSRLTENTSIEEIVITYGQLEYNALSIMRITRKTELAKIYTKDYVNYGQLTKLWSQFLT